jgi:DNA repair protein RadD
MGCGHEFTFMTKLQMAAASEDLIKGDLPVVEVLKVDHITYSRHEKVGSAPMMKVSYFCGIKAYDEYVLIEHADWGGRKARKWWKERSLMPFPESTDTALMMAPHLAPATHLRVWLNKKYPEIMSACFDGSAFGTTHATDVRPGADVEKPRSKYDTPERREALHCLEDDIPF